MDDLKKMNFDELQEMRAQIDVELKRRQAKEKQNARRKILEIASAHGIDIADLVSKERHYRNPNNQWELWNGRGRRPKWIKEWLESGCTLEELEVT
ncbi:MULTISPECIES: H-NS histone family protein [unclassified Bartonella]|uniref:H-NS histone family protein n=1 Tax=unclassified Bartonella TaxID=2645622 RepID=UPI002361CFDD